MIIRYADNLDDGGMFWVDLSATASRFIPDFPTDRWVFTRPPLKRKTKKSAMEAMRAYDDARLNGVNNWFRRPGRIPFR